ncbi:MAG TPA: hypothetical protein DIW81_01990, partial [Planctomycetaceae bacterium]|nr:hypothetical protein [Rubinisphaera sp.]HCS50355.1 hypothetical protein [Planctomycetaceae bacterium]
MMRRHGITDFSDFREKARNVDPELIKRESDRLFLGRNYEPKQPEKKLTLIDSATFANTDVNNGQKT